MYVHDANNNNYKFQSLSLILSEDQKWSIIDFFCYKPTEPMLVAVEAIVWINKNKSQDSGKLRNFHQMLHF